MRHFMKSIVAGAALIIAPLLLPGCDNEEKVLDIETPDGEIEVDRDPDNGDVDVDVNTDRP